jgi:hypothetical protein
VSGGMTVLLVRWAPGVNVAGLLGACDGPDPVQAEAARLATDLQPPEGWDYLWYLGPGEIFRPGTPLPSGQPTLCCDTHGDVGILRRPVPTPLEPGTALRWRWRVDALPADLREDTLPSHDYLSIAVEFDDGPSERSSDVRCPPGRTRRRTSSCAAEPPISVAGSTKVVTCTPTITV